MTDGPTHDIGPTDEMIHKWTAALLLALEDATDTAGETATDREIAMIQDLVSNRHTGTNQGDAPISPFEQEKLSARITALERRVELITKNYGPFSEPRTEIRRNLRLALAWIDDTANPDDTPEAIRQIRAILRRTLANPLLNDRSRED